MLLLTARQIGELQKVGVLDGVVVIDGYPMTLTDGDVPESVVALKLSSNVFDYLGVPPLLGRGFTPEDAPFGEEPRHVVVLGYSFWKSRYGGRPDVLGQTLQLNRERYTIIGVAAPNLLPAVASDRVYLPLRLTLDSQAAWQVQVKLKPGVTVRAAEARLQPPLEEFARETPARFPRDFRVQVASQYDLNVAPVKPTLLLLFVATALLLTIASANVSTLLVPRGAVRQHEFAVRQALGARRSRLFVQLLTESLLLSLIGAIVGVALASFGVPAMLRWLPANALRQVPATIELNAPVLVFSVGLALLTGVGFGLSPALSLSGPRIGGILNLNAARTTSGTRGQQRTLHLLIAGQIALTVVLLAGTGAAIQGLVKLYRTPLGYDPTHVLLFNVSLLEDSHTAWAERAVFYEELRRRVSRMPDIEIAALSVFTGVPPITGNRRSVEIAGRSPDSSQVTLVQIVSPEYFATLA